MKRKQIVIIIGSHDTHDIGMIGIIIDHTRDFSFYKIKHLDGIKRWFRKTEVKILTGRNRVDKS